MQQRVFLSVVVLAASAALAGCVVARPAYVAPAGVAYVGPGYAAPAPGYGWEYHARFGWGWRHPVYGWHRGWH